MEEKTNTRKLADTLGVSQQSIRNFAKKSIPRFANVGKGAWEFTPEEASIIADHFKDRLHGAGDVAKDESGQVDLQNALRELAVCRATCAGLERENQILRERLAKADEALEREQMCSRGFWSRLGQRLLGDGRHQ